ncbi:methyltransferase domain-containing protein [Streptomyces sp. NPDC087219]|uniref:methyltransferase domain-containing protein n=1 Tax=Streptomyces sp. NPDC087219 TaxID=3365770 RepID=UPI0038301696
MTQQLWSSQRHQTAIGRVGLSLPARRALGDLRLEPGRKVLDYGCGRGGDVRVLQQLGLDVTGWDPVHFPEGLLRLADVVLLTYVLNVIEAPPNGVRHSCERGNSPAPCLWCLHGCGGSATRSKGQSTVTAS